jgi:hypothetical protein
MTGIRRGETRNRKGGARAPPFLLGLLLLGQLLGGGTVAAQVTGSLVGRIQDAETGAGIPDASVALGSEFLALTDSAGFFAIGDIPPGEHTLRVVHIAYGDFDRLVTLAAGEELGLRIRLSRTTIELEPVIVEALTQREFDIRSRGTRRNEITREEISRSVASGGHLGHVLSRYVPGIRLRTDQSRSGAPVCVEFRSPVSLHETLACKHPMVFLDGVRVSVPEYLYTSLPVENIQRMEVIPPGEAGVAYGTDSRYGVILIETRTAANVLGEREDYSPRMGTTRYDWGIEPEPYPLARVMGSALIGTAIGLALGYAVADPCLTFDGISPHFETSPCSGIPETASHLAWMTFPQLGATLGARYAGTTSVSRGRFFHTFLAGSLAAIPGLVLSLTNDEDGFFGSDVLGSLIIGIGIPLSTTLADRAFRRVRTLEAIGR